MLPQTGAYAHHTENCGDKKTLKLGYLTLGLLVQILYVGTPIVLSLALRDASDDSPHFLEQGKITFHSSLHRRKGQINGLFMQTIPVVLPSMMGSKYCQLHLFLVHSNCTLKTVITHSH